MRRTVLCRWPNGVLSIVSGEDEKEITQQLLADGVCAQEGAVEGVRFMELPKGFRLHLRPNGEADFVALGWPEDFIELLKEWYPRIAALENVPFKTKRAALAAAAKAVALDCGDEPK